jgi:cell wall-associated NlpC family hydrolase
MSWANDYVGVPYVANGRGKDGADCWGIICMVYRDMLGIELPDYGVIDAADLLSVARALRDGQMGQWVAVEKPAEFDVVGMYGRPSPRSPRAVVHVGLYVKGGMVLHAQGKTHCVVERVASALMTHRIAGYWRHVDAM